MLARQWSGGTILRDIDFITRGMAYLHSSL